MDAHGHVSEYPPARAVGGRIPKTRDLPPGRGLTVDHSRRTPTPVFRRNAFIVETKPLMAEPSAAETTILYSAHDVAGTWPEPGDNDRETFRTGAVLQCNAISSRLITEKRRGDRQEWRQDFVLCWVNRGRDSMAPDLCMSGKTRI